MGCRLACGLPRRLHRAFAFLGYPHLNTHIATCPLPAFAPASFTPGFMSLRADTTTNKLAVQEHCYLWFSGSNNTRVPLTGEWMCLATGAVACQNRQ